MKEFEVNWSKAYYINGTLRVKATSPEEAYKVVDNIIGDQTGSLQYCPDDNLIEVSEINEIIKLTD